MESSVITSTTPIEECNSCYAKVLNDDVFCPNCGYPLKGSEQEQDDFILKRNYADIDIASFNVRLQKAANSLFYLAGVFSVFGIIAFFVRKDDPNVLALTLPNLILAIVFLALGGYSKKKPLACIISGLCLYVIVTILNVIDNPSNIARGIIFKIAIIGYLIKGIKSAIEIEKIKKEHNIV